MQLQQSPFLSLISDEQVQQTLALMGQPKDARLTPELAQQICERTASAAVLEGSIASLGSQYVVGLRAKNCSTGGILDEEQIQAARKEDVLNALSQIASTFRTRVGESLATVEKHDKPLDEATTPSLEALKAYSTGRKVHSASGPAALPLFKRATEIDPTFAMAHAFLGTAYRELGEYDLAAASIREAYRLRDRASDLEKFFITTVYDLNVTGNMEKAQQTCELWAQTYPRDWRSHGFLTGIIYPALGKYERAVDEGRKTIELNPDFAIAYGNLSLQLSSAEPAGGSRRHAAARLRGQGGSRRHGGPAIWHRLLERRPGRDGQARGSGPQKCRIGRLDVELRVFRAGIFRSLAGANAKSRQAVDLAHQGAHLERAALFQTGAALRQALFGNASAARHSAGAALDLSKAGEVQYGVAFALAVAGDASRSQRLADDLERRFPENTSVQIQLSAGAPRSSRLGPSRPGQSARTAPERLAL